MTDPRVIRPRRPATAVVPLDRGPCGRVGCGCPEERHRHHRSGDDCGTCGRGVCPAYRAPSRAPCARCGTPGHLHVSLTGGDVLVLPGVCPWWVRPAPAWWRAFAWLLGARRHVGHRQP